MKKILIRVLLLAVSFSLTGCSSNESDKIQINFGMWPEAIQVSDVAMYDTWKTNFEAENPEYEIVGTPFSYNLDTFGPLSMANQHPTVFQTWFTEPEKLVKTNAVRDITNQLVEMGWLDKMDPYMKDILTFNGKTYGVPRDGYGLGLVINLSIMEQVGIMTDHDGDGIVDIKDPEGNPLYPETFAELKEMSQLITSEMEMLGEEVAGFVTLSAGNSGGWQFTNIAWNFGANLQILDENGKWVSNLNDPKAVEALQWIKDMKSAGVLPGSTTVTYDDWSRRIGTATAGMAICGNDALANPIITFNMDKNDLAFVPLPVGPNGTQNTLFGGTPFMFANHATDEQVIGTLKFLEYIGQSPSTTEIAIESKTSGMETAVQKGMPILPTIKPWINEEYINLSEQLEAQYVNVHMENFNPFYDEALLNRRAEPSYYTQEMYKILDSIIQEVLSNPNANPQSLLDGANSTFQRSWMSRLD